MPIPSPERHISSNLTKKQQQEQLAAVYGVPMPQQLTEVEVNQMRQILAQHDSQNKPMTTIDLNNPPKEPYRFQKFPMMVYDLEHSHPARSEEQLQRNNTLLEVHIPAKVVFATVGSEDELQSALQAGWSDKAPDFTAEEETPLSPRYAGEAARLDEQIRRKPGRPARVVEAN